MECSPRNGLAKQEGAVFVPSVRLDIQQPKISYPQGGHNDSKFQTKKPFAAPRITGVA
jgi:hypothetical protein